MKRIGLLWGLVLGLVACSSPADPASVNLCEVAPAPDHCPPPAVRLDTATVRVVNQTSDEVYLAYPVPAAGWRGPLAPGVTSCVRIIADANVMAVDNYLGLAYEADGPTAIWSWRPRLGASSGWELSIGTLASQPPLVESTGC
jgi:hypothetical protein